MSPWPHDVANRGDALTLLGSLPDDRAAAAFFDPQHRGVLNRLKYGNEGARQRARCALAVVVAFGTKDLFARLRDSGIADALVTRMKEGDIKCKNA